MSLLQVRKVSLQILISKWQNASLERILYSGTKKSGTDIHHSDGRESQEMFKQPDCYRRSGKIWIHPEKFLECLECPQARLLQLNSLQLTSVRKYFLQLMNFSCTPTRAKNSPEVNTKLAYCIWIATDPSAECISKNFWFLNLQIMMPSAIWKHWASLHVRFDQWKTVQMQILSSINYHKSNKKKYKQICAVIIQNYLKFFRL